MLFESRLNPSDEAYQGEIEWTPLIDMVFILIVFFAVTMTFATQQSVMDVDLPQAAAAASASDTRRIVVERDGTINYAGQGPLTPAELGEILAGEPADGPGFEVAADRGVPYEHVMAVLDQLRRNDQRKIFLAFEQLPR